MVYTINNNKTTRSDIIELNYDKVKDFWNLNLILQIQCSFVIRLVGTMHETYFWDKLDNDCWLLE